MSRIILTPSTTPGIANANNLTEESATKTTELLTINHERYHTRWSPLGFHNQITHHLLSLWSLGASPDQIQEMFDYNVVYQAPLRSTSKTENTPVNLADRRQFKECLGKDEFYAHYLDFFKQEIGKRGVADVVKEYLLKRDDRADDLLARMFTDMSAAIIHLGCGLEFNQPSIVAEALASACVHDNWPKQVLLPTEGYVRSNPGTSTRPLFQTLDDLRDDPVISSGVIFSDPINKIRDGLLKRVPIQHLTPYLAQFQVRPDPDDLQRKLAEMVQTCAYMASAAQKPRKLEAFDYLLLHTVTLSIHFVAIMRLEWLSNEDKARLLEAKGRMDALTYAGCGSPELHLDRVRSYVPKFPDCGWPELFQRAIEYRDEGHVVKLIRALYGLGNLEEVEETPIRKSDGIRIAHMVLDSAERLVDAKDGGSSKLPDAVANMISGRVGVGGNMVVDNQRRWVFYCGLEQAWQFFPDISLEGR